MRQHRNNKQQISWAERTIRYGKEEKMGIVIFEYTSIFTDIYIYDCSTWEMQYAYLSLSGMVTHRR